MGTEKTGCKHYLEPKETSFGDEYQDVDGSTAWRTWVCNKCGKKFHEEYRLSCYVDAETGEEFSPDEFEANTENFA